jgi:hypothetical protein
MLGDFLGMHMCPVCYYPEMPYPAQEYNICPCCGTEFENDDRGRTHAQLRAFWIGSGARWFFRQPPAFWNPWIQLAQAGVTLPYGVALIERAGSQTLTTTENPLPEPETDHEPELAMAA